MTRTSPVAASGPEQVAVVHFRFWSAHLDFLRLLAKNGLLHT
ncbi:hypothetical protein [Microbacterium sp. bgisy203]